MKSIIRKSIVILSLVCCIPAGEIPCAPISEDVVIGKYVTFASKILEEERTVLVGLPDGYETGQNRYPVIYLLDGHILSGFSNLTALASIQADRGKAPEFIVVGIDTRAGYSRNTFPTPVEGWPESGGADRFIKFLNDELAPYIDGTYRTEDFRILTGQSNTGLLAIYALLTEPEAFDAYIAVSPSLGWCGDFIRQAAAAFFSKHKSMDKHLYIVHGSDDYPDLVKDAVGSFTGILEKHHLEKFRWGVGQVEKGGHVPYESFYRGLEFVFPDWEFPREIFSTGGVEALESHYDGLAHRYGFAARAPASVLDDIGYELLQQKKWRRAASIFELWVKGYAHSARAHYFLAVVREKLGENEAAAAQCRTALALNPELRQAADLLRRLEAHGEP